MTPEEEKHIDSNFENLEKLLVTQITGLKNMFDQFIKTTDSTIIKHETDIGKLFTKADKNTNDIIKIQGQVFTIIEVKKAENNTKETGTKGARYGISTTITIIVAIATLVCAVLIAKFL